MMMMMIRRRSCHVKGDVMCTMLLLVLFCLLFYVRQVLLSSGWDKPAWKLEILRPTSASRTLLGTNGARAAQESPRESPVSGPSEPHLPPSESKSKPPQAKSKAESKPKRKPKSRQKKAKPTKTAGAPLPTMPPFDFEGYLREKDNRNFKLLIDQPEKCQPVASKQAGGSRGSMTDLYMLIAVKSVAADFDKRQVVRRTWGKEDRSIRTVFLLGVPRNRTALPLWDQLLTYESQIFKDILLWDFEDTFFNLTLKETHFLEWVNHTCPHVRFIFKGDADVYVNIENILELLQEFVYGAALYPSYAGGGGFVMSGYTARRLSSACQQVELFPIDDVFLGMCLQLIGIKPSRHQGFRTFGIARPSAAPHLQTFDPCFYRELMVVHSLSVPQIWLMWNLLHDPKLNCHNRTRPTSGPFRWRIGERETDYGEGRVFVPHD
ncbi:UDP-GlcNAc:betaGal beta-1,3-N-acetylglucosaminyltransferase 9 isoform X2 [Dunckerocampus dactyliophorus]|uniref:UDP-GlcNAc:betaGal beta-1,3-N-acetylglucosaminyltransferase 9 isoform X2 n=1 Tax=Dunckerocampus dactyliophorus TaxID=161453 RepID=UPI002406B7E3|nr:UDP-GlcNAc:betaGal beta-1,3-N-acetylglucosaminyltransferase 9 isoform X2 [Dunckerocampus dactyliophorus]